MSKKTMKSKTNTSPKYHFGPTIIGLIIAVVICALINYVWITPTTFENIHFWGKIIAYTVICGTSLLASSFIAEITIDEYEPFTPEKTTIGIFYGIAVFAIVAVIGIALSGSAIFHASEYADIVSIETVDSAENVLQESDAERIAFMDTASARQLGDREIGSIENYSAFNVSDDYIQLNVKGDPVKIAPLEYTGFFKWMNNKDTGVTGYVTVSPTTMSADYVELKEGMKYVRSAYFSEYLDRHIHNEFPNKMYENTHFEIDNDGNPYYVSTVYHHNIGLFGGYEVKGAIITDPVSGECTYYELEDIPSWVDNVVYGDAACALYNWSGKYKNGYWNGTSFGANKGCMKTTSDFGYIAKDDDIYIYTGVTSMAADNSNLGFILVNERTGEYKYFAVSGANETSAMRAAEGEVQQYGYDASFPSLINVDGELTYIGVLKDDSGLVKLYYMVNVKEYGKVVVASTRKECLESYASKVGLETNKFLLESVENMDEDMEDNAVPETSETIESDADAQNTEETDLPTEDISITVKVKEYIGEKNGVTYAYLGTEDGKVYKVDVSKNEQILFVNVGDTVSGSATGNVLTLK